MQRGQRLQVNELKRNGCQTQFWFKRTEHSLYLNSFRPTSSHPPTLNYSNGVELSLASSLEEIQAKHPFNLRSSQEQQKTRPRSPGRQTQGVQEWCLRLQHSPPSRHGCPPLVLGHTWFSGLTLNSSALWQSNWARVWPHSWTRLSVP